MGRDVETAYESVGVLRVGIFKMNVPTIATVLLCKAPPLL